MKRLEMGEAEYRSLAHVATRVDFFAPLKGAELERLLSHIRLYRYEAGEAIFKKGDPADAFYIIHSGTIGLLFKPRLFWIFRRLALLEAGQFFGEMALLDQRPRSATVIAKTAVELFVLLKADFEAMLRQNPAFAAELKHIAALRKFEQRG